MHLTALLNVVCKLKKQTTRQRKLLLLMTTNPAEGGMSSHRTSSKIIILAMKLTSIILLSACMTASAAGFTQTVSLSVKNAPLGKVFEQVKKQTGYSFIWDEKTLKDTKPVSLELKNATIQQVLDLCIKNQPITYSIIDRLVLIKLRDLSPAGGGGNEQRMANSEQPPIDITGRVTDSDGNPLGGANVKVKGTNNGTTTNADGVFVLKGVNDNAVLEISYVGYETYTVSLSSAGGGVRKADGGGLTIIASLKLKPESLNEVIINKGYYTERQKLSVGNVGKVTADQIEKQPVNNPLLALSGRVPGLQVTQTSGMTGAGVTVRIQGQNSLQNGSGPLYVVDGVPITTEIPTPLSLNYSPYPNSGVSYINQGITGRGNALSFLNPSDIESISVLKDADATAIYGSRAANGAILITTKKGRSGKTIFNVDLQQGFGEVGHFMKLLNTEQYLEMRHEAFVNDGRQPSANRAASGTNIYAPDLMIWDTTKYTDWQKELIGGRAQYTDANVGLSGGSSQIQYLVGANYHRETTVFPGNFSDERGSMHISLNNNNDLKQKFHFQISSSYSADNNKLPAMDPTRTVLNLAPDAPALYDIDGSLNWQIDASGKSTFVNPLAAMFFQNYSTKTNNLIANGNFSYDILPGLKLTSAFGFTNLQSNDIRTNSLLSQRPENRPTGMSYSSFGDSKTNTWSIEPQLSYKKDIAKGKFDGLIGTSFQRTLQEASYLSAFGFDNDQSLTNPKAATTTSFDGYDKRLYKYNAVFSRLNYTYSNRYILNLTGRRDGSTRFGSNNKFHNFWSAGIGWIFSQERFFFNEKSFFSFGKLKVSYGTTGSDQIGDYRFLSLYNSTTRQVPYQNTTSLAPGSINNPFLQWEETRKLNLGLDLGFLNDRIFITANYSRNRSSNQLLTYNLPRITGRASILLNFPATIQNTNWELLLNTKNIKNKNFNWTTSVNLTIPRNKLIDFPNLDKTSYSSTYIIGQPISLIKLYHFSGVDPATGLYSFQDNHGNATTSPTRSTDATILASNFSKYYGGLQNSIQYKKIQLDLLFQFVKQIAPSPAYYFGVSPGNFSEFSSGGNQPASVMGRWQKPGDNAATQKFAVSNASVNNGFSNFVGSDAYYLDASYIRLKNVSLSYELPHVWIQNAHLQSCRLFVQGQNLLTITNYKGLDPETPGYTILPPLRVITFGVNLKL